MHYPESPKVTRMGWVRVIIPCQKCDNASNDYLLYFNPIWKRPQFEKEDSTEYLLNEIKYKIITIALILFSYGKLMTYIDRVPYFH